MEHSGGGGSDDDDDDVHSGSKVPFPKFHFGFNHILYLYLHVN